MSYNRMTTDLNIIRKLPDSPVVEGGMTPEEFQEAFDEGPNAIKTYINNYLLGAIEAVDDALADIVYTKAVAAGYTGTKADLYEALAALPSHHARHLPGGDDPIIVQTGNIEDAAVTGAKIASGAVTASYTATITTTWTGSDPYTQAITVSGLLATDTVYIDLVPSDTYATALDEIADYALIYRAVVSTDTLTVYATAPTSTALNIQIKAVRK